MPAAGIALLRAAESMDATAAMLEKQAAVAAGAELAELARSWREDAETLRKLGVWLFVSVSADGMVHDPEKAHEINLENWRT